MLTRNRKKRNMAAEPDGMADTQRSASKRKYMRRQKRMRVWTAVFCVILAIYVAIGVTGAAVVQYMTRDMPTLDINDFVGDESSRVYDANGNLLIELGTYFRENVSYDKMPESLVDAFLSIEDSRFFEHNGFDIPRFTSSAIHNVLSGDLTGQGGSTFTMQLVKNSYFSVDNGDASTSYSAGKGIKYKIQQIMLSLQLEQKLDKKTIFELYVNRLNFGNNIRGCEMASRYYFGKDVWELNLSESAMLAGIVNLPNYYNPYAHLDYATQRRDQVLYMMLYHGYITEEEYKLATSIKVEDELVGEYADIKESNTKYQEYIDVALEEAVQMTGYDPVSKGMDIYTAMNPDIQDKIIDIEAGNSITYADDLMQTAIMTIDHTSGEIVGIGGGRNYTASGGSRLLNRATDMYKQPGSTAKPVIPYALAFEYLGFSLDEQVIDMRYSYPNENRIISDYDGRYLGVISIKDALADSRNIPAIMTLGLVTDKIGKEQVISYMQAIGYDSMTTDNYHLSIAIGANDFTATVEQMCGAHAMLMNLGVYNKPHTITRIVMTNNDTYYPEGQNQRVLSSGSAYLVTQLLANDVTQTKYGTYMSILKRSWPVYAKTGTTDWDSSGAQYGIPSGVAKDEWMIASNGKYTNAVWMGYDQAVAGENTYLAQWKLALNIPGNINSQLIDLEASITDDATSAVQKPDDLTEVSYVKGTWPHVNVGKTSGTTVTSIVSNTGLANTPQVDSMSDSYRITAKGYIKGSTSTATAEPTATPSAETEEKTETNNSQTTNNNQTTNQTNNNTNANNGNTTDSGNAGNTTDNNSNNNNGGNSTDNSGGDNTGGNTGDSTTSGGETSGGNNDDTGQGSNTSGSGQ